MPSVRFWVAASSLTVTIVYLLIRKHRRKTPSGVKSDLDISETVSQLNSSSIASNSPTCPLESNYFVNSHHKDIIKAHLSQKNSEINTDSQLVEGPNLVEVKDLIDSPELTETLAFEPTLEVTSSSLVESCNFAYFNHEEDIIEPNISQKNSEINIRSQLVEDPNLVEVKDIIDFPQLVENLSLEHTPEANCTISPGLKEKFNSEMLPSYLPPKQRHSSSPGSDNVSPKAITPETSSNCSYVPDTISYGYFNDPENDIIEDSPEFFCGKQIPKVLIPNNIWQLITDKNVWSDSFCIPARMGGVLIGRFGKNVRELRSQWKAEFTLNMSPENQDMLIFRVACPIEYKPDVLNWVSQRFKMRPSRTTIGNPNQLKVRLSTFHKYLQRYLPFGKTTPVQIRSSYGLKEMFVTVPDEKFVKFLEMQREMDLDYSNNAKQRMQLCEPVTSGTVSVLPHSQGFARALILKVFHVWPVKYALYFLLDHGVFGLIQLNEIRKIRAKYMRVPFQAIHISWAHAIPLFNDMPEMHLLRSYFASGQIHATAVRMETCCRASVVFTDLMVVSNHSPTLLPAGPFGSGSDQQAFPPLATSQNAASAELKMVDVLAMCCRAGLYTVAPLVIYPDRQCWLNQSDTPYCAYMGGEIDYQSYVSYILEDGSIKSSPTSDPEQKVKPQKSKRGKSHRNRGSKKTVGPSKSETTSADEKENCLKKLVVVNRDQNNNRDVVEVQRPADNPWGKFQTAPAPKLPSTSKITLIKPKEIPNKLEEVKIDDAPVKLTMAQIVAMAPTPPQQRIKLVSKVKEEPKKPNSNQKLQIQNSNNGKQLNRRPKSKTFEAKSSLVDGPEPRRRPLKSRNSQHTSQINENN